MKLNLALDSDGEAIAKPFTLKTGESAPQAPAVFQELLAIEGIASLFAISDFVTLTRKGSADWPPILTVAGQILGIAEGAESSISESLQSTTNAKPTTSQKFAQVDVAIQKFRGIPVQVRVMNDAQQARVALPDRFNQALQRAIEATGADYVAERVWAPYQPQFGEVDAIAHQIAEELTTLVDEPTLAILEKQAIKQQTVTSDSKTSDLEQSGLITELQQIDWKRRLKAIQQIEVDEETFSVVVDALQDERNSIRRWAAALLGASERADAVPPLVQMLLEDASPIVRRTAGDALSDLGDAQAIAPMITALGDASALVRWRAARFLTELGDESAIAPLTKAIETEQEFDVRVEMSAALDRIQAGEAAQLPMWMRISNAGSIETAS